jgi:hypothetical protein
MPASALVSSEVVLRARAGVTISPIDSALLIAALPELARRWRGLEFHNGMVIDRRGRRREGLRVETGTHPRAGTRYRIVTPRTGTPTDATPPTGARTASSPPAAADVSDSSAGTSTTVTLVEVTADDVERIGLRFTDAAGAVVDVDLHRPATPDRITATSVVRVGGTWPFRGAMTVDVRLDLATIPPGENVTGEPQLVVELRHKRLRVRSTVLIGVDGNRWDLAFDLAFVGRGVARPLFRPGTPIISRILRREITNAVGELPDQVAAFNRELARLSGRPASPTQLAINVLDLFLAEIVDTVPSGRPA